MVTDRRNRASTPEDGCRLCGLPTATPPIRNDDGETFCCRGCLDVSDALADVDGVDAEEVRRRREVAVDDSERSVGDSDSESVPDGYERSFFRVDGMHCVTCESFVESVACGTDGVENARASYVTDTVRIDHDPDAVDDEELTERLTGLGYRANARDDEFARRQAENTAFVRLAVGVLFGMMVMFQYVVLIYPTYFDGLFYDERTAEFLAESMAATGGRYLFVVIAVLTTIVLVVAGKPLLRGAYVAIRTRSPNMDLLVSIAAVSAYLYSHLVVATGGTHVYYDVTVAIVVVVTVGRHYESTAKSRATELLSELSTVRVREARLLPDPGDGKTDGGDPVSGDPISGDPVPGEVADGETVPVEDLVGGERVLVRTGERVPVDGTVLEGTAAVDEAVITGESLPATREPGDAVVGGSVVRDGALVVEVAPGGESGIDRLSTMVWDLQSSNRGIQKLADRLATIFVPVVLVLAAVVSTAYLVTGSGVTAALLVGLTVLIVSCPCALGLATPLATAAGVREALERRLVIFDETVFERIHGADTVVFDKTGTLTTGEMSVLDSTGPAEAFAAAAALERRSGHPVAEAIVEAFGHYDGSSADVAFDGGATASVTPAVDDYRSHDDGVSGVVDGREVAVGHPALFERRGWTVPEEVDSAAETASEAGRVPVLVGRDGAVEGVATVGDEFRPGWEAAIDRFAERGVEVVVLTGDDSAASETLSNHPGIDRVFAGVPPEGKAETVSRLGQRGRTVMVGDGTNDAPALASADLGIAMGGGTAMAADAADVAVLEDDLESVETVFELARATDRRVKGNVGWAFCYNAIAIPLAITGLLNPLFAAVAMATSSLLVVTNSSRDLL
ncbi:Cation transport ATPase [Halalkaliarchaeum sp. AArc-CO]|uniref:heavy metal translocating P-type ATPase n=1 Tax=Halalkaliarchaeum sp. AArc-CO TaxID=2866381 RepID=UPI00217D68B2|nr:cation-translocating P-type ATPase [Halalkaliarchaeum sp. AArc-CO]UWG50596.1 Cation transport ATPase [Halalkaliarchaeum sp. AArc-CO]